MQERFIRLFRTAFKTGEALAEIIKKVKELGLSMRQYLVGNDSFANTCGTRKGVSLQIRCKIPELFTFIAFITA